MRFYKQLAQLTVQHIAENWAILIWGDVALTMTQIPTLVVAALSFALACKWAKAIVISIVMVVLALSEFPNQTQNGSNWVCLVVALHHAEAKIVIALGRYTGLSGRTTQFRDVTMPLFLALVLGAPTQLQRMLVALRDLHHTF